MKAPVEHTLGQTHVRTQTLNFLFMSTKQSVSRDCHQKEAADQAVQLSFYEICGAKIEKLYCLCWSLFRVSDSSQVSSMYIKTISLIGSGLRHQALRWFGHVDGYRLEQ